MADLGSTTTNMADKSTNMADLNKHGGQVTHTHTTNMADLKHGGNKSHTTNMADLK